MGAVLSPRRRKLTNVDVEGVARLAREVVLGAGLVRPRERQRRVAARNGACDTKKTSQKQARRPAGFTKTQSACVHATQFKFSYHIISCMHTYVPAGKFVILMSSSAITTAAASSANTTGDANIVLEARATATGVALDKQIKRAKPPPGQASNNENSKKNRSELIQPIRIVVRR